MHHMPAGQALALLLVWSKNHSSTPCWHVHPCCKDSCVTTTNAASLTASATQPPPRDAATEAVGDLVIASLAQDEVHGVGLGDELVGAGGDGSRGKRW